MNLFCLQAWCWEELRISRTRFLFDTNIKYYLFKMCFSQRAAKWLEWAQFWVKITRMYIFICDNCRSHRVKVVNCLLPAEACACLFSSLGNTVCVRARAYHFILPPSLFSCFGCFVLFPSSHPQCRKQTLGLSVLP